MADEKVIVLQDETLFVREIFSTRKGRQFKFYDSKEQALLDEDSQVKAFVYKVSLSLLGEIKKVIQPVPGEAAKPCLTLVSQSNAN